MFIITIKTVLEGKWTKILGIFLYSTIFFGLINHFYKKQKLDDNYSITKAIVYDGANPKGGGKLRYKFLVDKDTIYGSRIFGGSYSRMYKHFLNKVFLVAYQKDNPENSELILLKSDYNRFKIDYPKNMEWVQDLYDWW